MLFRSQCIGFPPADHDVRDFLTVNDSRVTVHARVCAFLEALFDETAKLVLGQSGVMPKPRALAGLYLCEDPQQLAEKFREYMNDGVSMVSHGDFRRSFYKTVVRRAKEVRFPDSNCS